MLACTRVIFRSLLRPSFKIGFCSSVNFQSFNTLNKTAEPYMYSGLNKSPLVRYTSQHEWIAFHPKGIAFLGITKYGSDALGDINYLELPEKDAVIEKGSQLASIESVKSASEFYSPVSGTVDMVNPKLERTHIINEDPMGEGWIAKLKLKEPESIDTNDELLTLEQYEEFLKTD